MLRATEYPFLPFRIHAKDRDVLRRSSGADLTPKHRLESPFVDTLLPFGCLFQYGALGSTGFIHADGALAQVGLLYIHGPLLSPGCLLTTGALASHGFLYFDGALLDLGLLASVGPLRLSGVLIRSGAL